MNSLAISDKEKYGESSPMTAPVDPKGSKKKRKTAPTFEVCGPQVAALDMEDAKVGKVYIAKVKLVVKAVADGESYDSTVDEPGKNKKPMRVTVQLLAADPIPDGTPEHENEETPEEEAGEQAAGDDDEEESDAEDANEPESEDEEEVASERVSPKDAKLPE